MKAPVLSYSQAVLKRYLGQHLLAQASIMPGSMLTIVKSTCWQVMLKKCPVPVPVPFASVDEAW